MDNPLQHTKNCTPFQPCKVCKAVKFLKEKLESEDFEIFVQILEGSNSTFASGIQLDKQEFSVRTSNVLKNANLITLGNLLTQTETSLLQLPNLGRKELNEIKAFLDREGCSIQKN